MPVLGLVQCKGRVVAKVVPNVKRATVFPHITKHVPVKGTIYTDQYPAYTTLNRLGYTHGRVNHEEVWVDGDARPGAH